MKINIKLEIPDHRFGKIDFLRLYAGNWGKTYYTNDLEISLPVEAVVKPASELSPEKIISTESRSSTKTRENIQLINGEFGTRIFIDWQNRNFTVSKNDSLSV